MFMIMWRFDAMGMVDSNVVRPDFNIVIYTRSIAFLNFPIMFKIKSSISIGTIRSPRYRQTGSKISEISPSPSEIPHTALQIVYPEIVCDNSPIYRFRCWVNSRVKIYVFKSQVGEIFFRYRVFPDKLLWFTTSDSRNIEEPRPDLRDSVMKPRPHHLLPIVCTFSLTCIVP